MKQSNEVSSPESNTPEVTQAQTSTHQHSAAGVNEQPVTEPIFPQKTNKKWLIPALIGFVVVTLGIAGYFAYQNFQLKKERPDLIQTTPTSTIPPKGQSNDEGQPETPKTQDDKYISYTTNEGLVVSDIAGTKKRTVFDMTGPYFSWDWNPVASEIIANNGILKNIDTGVEKKVPDGRCHNWSPDGSKIAYESGGGLLYVEISNLTNPIKIADLGSFCGGSNSVFHWLPDSKSLIYLANNGNPYEMVQSIVKYNVDNGSTTEIYQDEKGSGQITSPSISPDGTKVVFMMSVDKGDNLSQLTENVYTINIDGSGLTQLTNLESEGEYGQRISVPIFSTDSNSIFLVNNSSISKYQGLSMLDIKSRTITSLSTEIANVYSPATISPDGKYVAYDAFDKVIIVDLETKNKTVIDNAGFVLWQK